jgi:hypothetical protein
MRNKGNNICDKFVCEEFIFPQNQGSLGDNAFLYQKS